MSDLLARLKELEAKSSPAPWKDSTRCGIEAEDADGLTVLYSADGREEELAIAIESRNALPALLRVAEAAEALITVMTEYGGPETIAEAGVFDQLRAALEGLK